MPSFAQDFIINPVLRQARRLSNFSLSDPAPALPLQRSLDNESTEGLSQHDKPGASFKNGVSTMDLDPLDMGHPSDTARLFRSDLPSSLDSASVLTYHNNRPLPFHLRSSTPPPVTVDEASDDEPEPSLSFSASSPGRPSTAHSLGATQPIPVAESRGGLHSDNGTGIPSSLPSSFYGRTEIPEDDGMGALRRRIIRIHSTNVPSNEKARRMHSLLTEGYSRSQVANAVVGGPSSRPHTPSSPRISEAPAAGASPAAATGALDKFWQMARGEQHPLAPPETYTLSKDDLSPTFVPVAPGAALNGPRHLGCEHYRRNVKLQCVTCQKWYTCRLCHNDAEGHVLPRQETRNMLCMLCGHAQRASDMCVNCGEFAARYYCGICKLWNDDPDKSIYHCPDCGICRVGEGLGKDFVHCKKCGNCIHITTEETHRCREGAMDCDCPICGEYMFTSHKGLVTERCGHMIHQDCRKEYIKTAYKCPICSKSIENMESQFRRLDKHLEEQPMPPEYRDTRAAILCNDCGTRMSTRYHWGGLRCEVCLSYNTVEMGILNSPHPPPALEQQQVVQSLVEPVAPGTSTDPTAPPVPALLNAPTLTAARAIQPSSRPGHGTRASLGSHSDYFRDVSSPVMSPESFARSLSPLQTFGAFASRRFGGNLSDEEDDEDASESGDEDDEVDDNEENDDDEDDDDEEEEIALFGHR